MESVVAKQGCPTLHWVHICISSSINTTDCHFLQLNIYTKQKNILHDLLNSHVVSLFSFSNLSVLNQKWRFLAYLLRCKYYDENIRQLSSDFGRVQKHFLVVLSIANILQAANKCSGTPFGIVIREPGELGQRHFNHGLGPFWHDLCNVRAAEICI